MYKIRKVTFKNHPILKNLTLDFCDNNGKAVDTVIFAGENGTGKSSIINELYKMASYQVDNPMYLELEDNGKIIELNYYIGGGNYNLVYVQDKMDLDTPMHNTNFKHTYRFSGIYSDVDINFHARDISNVTSLTLDSKADSRRSSDDLPTQINQLLVDIQTMDDQALAYEYRKAKDSGQSVENIEFNQRMPRFTNAFNRMFETLSYNRVVNNDSRKTIAFKKYDKEIPIDNLSSGEKQVIYRGCFLLKDINATKGAFVFIDEPEISLHPTWQMKVMDYYKGIFTKDGSQTSQIFAVTHSPFIIHNDNRVNDKVLVLSRDDQGNVVVKDRPLYFKCNSEEVVKDAFQIYGFNPDRKTVYLEGPTDEKYFKKTVEVFGLDIDFDFKWIGYEDEKGKEQNTGCQSLKHAADFLRSQKNSIKKVCLFDCDVKGKMFEHNNVITMKIPQYENTSKIRKGIENSLILDSINLEKYRIYHEEEDDYGGIKRIPELKKMELCESICSLDKKQAQSVLRNLKDVIELVGQSLSE